MLIFPGWREVGRAMRWARQQDEVQGPHVRDLPFGRRYAWGWRADGQVVTVTLTWGISYSCSGRGPRTFRLDNLDPVEVLRVLAALGFISTEVAEVAPC